MSILIENKVSFSESKLWDWQRGYYNAKGVEAWSSNEVPFEITSNPFIASSYANVIVRFIQDYSKQNPETAQEPFYILELGAGTGQFSYYLLKALLYLLSELDMNNVNIRYVMSDMSKKNINFWKENNAFDTFVRKDILYFAELDLESDFNEIILQQSDIILSKKHCLKNPLTIISNYIFDALRNDVFAVKNNKLYESLVSLTTEEDNINNGQPKDWKKIHIEYEDVEIKSEYYKDPDFDAVLEDYRTNLDNSYFLFPIASLNALKKLKSFSSDKMFILASDKAHTMIQEHQHFGFPKTAIHGNSFSIMANFDAIGRVFEHWSGSKLLQTSYTSFTTAAFFSNLDFNKLPETRLALELSIKNFGPCEYFLLSFHVSSSDQEASLETYISILELSKWNPYIYSILNEQILKLVKNAKYSELEYLAENIHKVAENFYFIPNTSNLFFNIGIFFHDIEMFDKAIPYYKKSLSIFGKEYYTLYNLGICFYKTDNYRASLNYFKQALEYDQEEDLINWIKIVEDKLELLKAKLPFFEEHA